MALPEKLKDSVKEDRESSMQAAWRFKNCSGIRFESESSRQVCDLRSLNGEANDFCDLKRPTTPITSRLPSDYYRGSDRIAQLPSEQKIKTW
jgi:hypothetical protein